MLYYMYMIVMLFGINLGQNVRNRSLKLQWSNTTEEVSKKIKCNNGEVISEIDLSIPYNSEKLRNVSTDSPPLSGTTDTCEKEILEKLEKINSDVKNHCEQWDHCEVNLRQSELDFLCKEYRSICGLTGSTSDCLATEGNIHYGCVNDGRETTDKEKRTIVRATLAIALTSVIVTLVTVTGIYCCWRKRKCCNNPGPKLKENRKTEEERALPCPRTNQNNYRHRNQTTRRRSENIYQVINELEQPVAEVMLENSVYDGGSLHTTGSVHSETMDVPKDKACPEDERKVDNKTYYNEPQKEMEINTANMLDKPPDVVQVAQQREYGIEGDQPNKEPGKTMHSPETQVHWDKTKPDSGMDGLKAGHYTYAYGHFENEGRKRLS